MLMTENETVNMVNCHFNCVLIYVMDTINHEWTYVALSFSGNNRNSLARGLFSGDVWLGKIKQLLNFDGSILNRTEINLCFHSLQRVQHQVKN